jgi:hypothetical protein
MSPRIHATFGLIASVVVACAVGWGFVLAGSPAMRRMERFDQRRLHDLQAIAREIRMMVLDPNNEASRRQLLPKTLAEAAQRARNERLSLHDPETGEPYEYMVKSETLFELCARFTRARDSDQAVFWNHPAGSHCFTIDVLKRAPDLLEYTPF